MKLNRILIALIFVVVAASCANGTTITGNPPTVPVPVPSPVDDPGNDDGGTIIGDPAAFTLDVIGKHSLWKDVYYTKFDVTERSATIVNDNSRTLTTIKFKIDDTGSIFTEQLVNRMAVVGYLENLEDGEQTKLVIKLVSDTNEVLAHLEYTDSVEDELIYENLYQALSVETPKETFNKSAEVTKEVKKDIATDFAKKIPDSFKIPKPVKKF